MFRNHFWDIFAYGRTTISVNCPHQLLPQDNNNYVIKYLLCILNYISVILSTKIYKYHYLSYQLISA